MFKKFGFMAVVMIGLMFVSSIASYAETVYVEAEAGGIGVWNDPGSFWGSSNEAGTQSATFIGVPTIKWRFTLETVYNQTQGDAHKIWVRQASYPAGAQSANFLWIDAVPYWLQFANTGSVDTAGYVWLDLTAIIEFPNGIGLTPGLHTIEIQKLVPDVALYDAMLVTPDMTLVPTGKGHPGLKADGNLLLEAEYSYNGDHVGTSGYGVVDESSGPGKSGNYAVQKFWPNSKTSWGFSVSNSGNHTLWLKLASWDGGESANTLTVDGVDSYLQYTNGSWATWNGTAWVGYVAGSSWKWLNLGTFNLAAGDHRVSIKKLVYDNAVYDALLVTTNQGSCHQVLEAEDAYDDAVASIVADTGASGGFAVNPLSGYDARFIFIASTAGTYDISIVHKALSPFTSGNIDGSIFIDNEGTQNGEVGNTWQHAKPTTFEPRSIGSFTLSAGPHIIRIHTAPQFWMAMDALIISGNDCDSDGYTIAEGDCNDTDANVYPGACEIAGDGIDQNCDGLDVPDAPTCADGANGSGNGLWKNHGQFVSTVASYYDTYGTLLCLTSAQIEEAISQAAKSDCGMPGDSSRTQPGKGIGRQ